MDHSEARVVKAQLTDYVQELAGRMIRASDVADGPVAPTLALGLAPVGDGTYSVAVRYRLGSPSVRAIARRVVEQVGPVADVRRTGRIRPLASAAPDGEGSASGPADADVAGSERLGSHVDRQRHRNPIAERDPLSGG